MFRYKKNNFDFPKFWVAFGIFLVIILFIIAFYVGGVF